MSTKNINIKIKGNNYIHGNVSLSGDTYSAIFLTLFFTVKTEAKANFTLTNVPRSSLFLEFIQVASKIGIQVNWISVDTVEISCDKITNDLSFLKSKEDENYVKIFLPAILGIQGRCKLSLNDRKIVQFYKELDYRVKIDVKSELIGVERPLKQVSNSSMDLKNADDIEMISRLILSAGNENFKCVLPKSAFAYKYNLYNQNISFDQIKGKEHRVISNYSEFLLYSSLAAFSEAEVNFDNFKLDEHLAYLLRITDMIANYEVTSSKLKIWNDPKKPLLEYDFSTLTDEEIGYLMVILSHVAKTTVSIVSKKSTRLIDLIKDLNIQGFGIEYKESGDYFLIKIKSFDVGNLKSDFSNDAYWVGVYIFMASIIPGNSELNSCQDYLSTVPELIGKVEQLNIDISTS